MRYTKLNGNTVENIIKATPEFVSGKPEYIQSDTAQIGDVWNGSEFTTPEPVINLDEAKEKKLLAMKTEYQAKIDKLYEAYPAFEMDSFPVQKAEWTAWMQDNTAPTPYVDALAASRNKTKEEMMQRIGTAAVGIATIQGELQKRREAVQAATTIDEVESA